MRVLIVTTPLPTPERPNTMAPLARQINSLRALGVTMDVLEVDGPTGIKYPMSFPRFREMLARVDLVHAHFGYCGWLARLQRRKPLVMSYMGSDLLGAVDADGRVKPFSRVIVQVNRFLAKTMDSIVVKSRQMAAVLAPLHVHVIPNGVDTTDFRPMDPADVKSALGWHAETRRVLFAGDPRNPRKGYPLASAAIQFAAQQLGEHLEIATLRKVDANLVPLYMNACDAMVMASYIEGSPNVVKEAMACNLPTISVAVGDVEELLSDVAECAIGPRDPEALGLQLARVLAHRRRSNGREALFKLGLDLESVARRIKDLYESVLASPDAPR